MSPSNKRHPLIDALAGIINFNKRRPPNRLCRFYYELGLLLSFIECTAHVQPIINLADLTSRIIISIYVKIKL